jgi:hypothetical protein
MELGIELGIENIPYLIRWWHLYAFYHWNLS